MLEFKSVKVLQNKNGAVKVAYDTITNSYSIGLRTDGDMSWKLISKDLFDELSKLEDIQTNK
ncbi:hypothetical protein [Paraliobacillus ryukyuensis]|uniref:hypothetical protein n=1 Tax=Paraliobacillus ryukyuensis TaxID=200904 RepID=UPI0009A6BA02|nr:hypothetical protein [Paraliobacillus ryukyuensis]